MGRDVVVGLALVAALDAPAEATQPGGDAPSHPAVVAALRVFARPQPGNVEAFLGRRRPAPPAPDRARVRAALPRDGAVEPSARQRRKLAAVAPVLLAYGRQDDLDVHVFAGEGVAWLGFHARSVLLVTAEALDLLREQELVALTAHELAHDVVWDDYEAAHTAGDALRIQELELHCDGIAVLVLQRMGAAPDALSSGLRRLAGHSARFGKALDEWEYVPLTERVRFIRTLASAALRR